MQIFRELTDLQAGVITRQQLLDNGLSDNDLQRLVRRKELVRVHTGVYVNHTGPLSWTSRAWAAVLFHGHAALCEVSALNLAGHPIHVGIEWPRSGTALPGVKLHRIRNLQDRVQWNLSPPRLRVEEAALDVAGRSSNAVDAVAVLTDVCQRRRTTPERLLRVLEARARTPRGAELRKLLVDVADGAHSALEQAYVSRVERAHGLPRGRRQQREMTAAGVVHRDVVYEACGVAVELDGYAWHGSAAERWADMSRDLVAAADGLLTVRLGWRHTNDDACETARGMAEVLTRRGWQGSARPCSRVCALRGDFQAQGA
jgi:hypothetical protein